MKSTLSTLLRKAAGTGAETAISQNRTSKCATGMADRICIQEPGKASCSPG